MQRSHEENHAAKGAVCYTKQQQTEQNETGQKNQRIKQIFDCCIIRYEQLCVFLNCTNTDIVKQEKSMSVSENAMNCIYHA